MLKDKIQLETMLQHRQLMVTFLNTDVAREECFLLFLCYLGTTIAITTTSKFDLPEYTI